MEISCISFILSVSLIRDLPGTSQSPFASRPSCSSSPDESPEYSQEMDKKNSSMFHTQKNEFSENRPKEESSLPMFRNQFPPPPPSLTDTKAETSMEMCLVL